MLKYKQMFLTAILSLALPIGAMADDTDIYGTTSVSLKPNVMIILDNSGSMSSNKDVGGENYIRTKDYSAFPQAGWTPVGMTSVYYLSSNRWYLLTNNVTNIRCSTLITQLNTYGYANNVRITIGSLACSGSRYNLKLGNFRNYENSTLDPEYRYVVAQRAVASLLDNTTDKNFGLMHFNGNAEGGYVRFPCGTSNSTISTYVKGMTSSDFSTWTPLAETLAEAGLYFAGKASWFNSGVSYTSPITQVCQKNYIILVTDGEPTQDINTRLWQTVYMNGKVIGDYDRDGEDFTSTGAIVRLASDGSLLLDDVAKFLFTEDIHTMGTGTGFVNQNIITHTIGLRTEVPILNRAASNGGGLYFYASTSTGLQAALDSINNSISETNAVFLAPSVPVNRTIRTAESDWLYLAYFKPQNTGEWLGNIKKFAIGDNGEIYGSSNGTNVVDESQVVIDQYGMIKDNAWSFWTKATADGNDVVRGGLGALMNEMYDIDVSGNEIDTRNIYYYTGGSQMDLSNAINHFTVDNASLTVADNVIKNVRHFKENWKLGAIIHSEPAIVHYSNTQSVIFVGANDGMLHCFNDTDGNELWGFIPPGQKDNLPRISDANHDYYVDGSPTVTYGNLITNTQLLQPNLMIFGERRGGDHYYVLDINSYSQPKWKYQINPDIMASSETLGQSWSKPKECNIATGTETSNGKTVPTYQNVFMIAGGYDTNQDLDTPAISDNVGKAIVSVDTSTGALAGFRVSDATSGLTTFMKHCIVDINTTSTYSMPNGKDITTRVYAGNLGGHVFAFADDRIIASVNGTDTVKSQVPNGIYPIKLCLFNAPGKKIFYAPASSRINNSYSEWVVFGTGDREHPLNTSTVNRIYAVKNDWMTQNTESNLADLTENLIVEGSNEQKKSTFDNVREKNGWYITFYDPGEKMTSSPLIINGFIYFTTYVPASGSVASDPCVGVGATGTSYLWAIELQTGIPAYDSNKDNIKKKSERRTQVAVMAQPKASGEDTIFTPAMFKVPNKINFDYFFWRQR